MRKIRYRQLGKIWNCNCKVAKRELGLWRFYRIKTKILIKKIDRATNSANECSSAMNELSNELNKLNEINNKKHDCTKFIQFVRTIKKLK